MRRSCMFALVGSVVLWVGVAAGGESCFLPLDLQPQANQPRDETFPPGEYPGDNLAELPGGVQRLGGVEFAIGPKVIQMGGKFLPEHPKQVTGIEVGETIEKLDFLHCARWGAYGGPNNPAGNWVPDGLPIAYYEVVYQDGSSEAVPVIYGFDVRDWWSVWDHEKPTRQSRVAWTGISEHLRHRVEAKGTEKPLRLYLSTWKNPRPQVPVARVNVVSLEQTPALICVAITAERQPRDYRREIRRLEQLSQQLQREIESLKRQMLHAESDDAR